MPLLSRSEELAVRRGQRLAAVNFKRMKDGGGGGGGPRMSEFRLWNEELD